MAIEILLRRSVEKLGRVGDVVKVRPGYARNFLVPHGYAVEPTKENLRLVAKDKAVEAAEEADRAKERADLLAKLTGLSVTLEAKSNPEGHLFGSVGPKQVADALVAKGFPTVGERHVKMEHVKELGEYEVTLHLAADAETKLKLWVVDEVTKLATKKTPEEQAAAAARAARAVAAAKIESTKSGGPKVAAAKADAAAKTDAPKAGAPKVAAAKAEKAPPAAVEKAPTVDVEKPAKADKSAKGDKKK